MRLYIVNKISSFVDNPRINAFHYEMFHGTATRDGNPYPRLSDEHVAPLRITRTGRNVPAVSYPCVNFVVTESLARRMRVLSGVRLKRVTFDKVVDIPYTAGQSGWLPEYGIYGTDHIYQALEDRSDLRASLGCYYEVITARLTDVMATQEARTQVAVDSGFPYGFATVELNEHVLQKYSILSDVVGKLMNERAFQLLDSSLDRDYFNVLTIDLM